MPLSMDPKTSWLHLNHPIEVKRYLNVLQLQIKGQDK